MARQNIFGTVFGVDAGMMQIAVFPNMSKRRAGEIVDRILKAETHMPKHGRPQAE